MLDTTLAGALRDLLQPLAVMIVRAVGAEGEQHWFTRARLARGDVAASGDPLWVDLEQLPALTDRAHWLDCLRRQEVLSHEQPGQPGQVCTLFPLFGDREVSGVVEVLTEGPLAEADRRLVGSMLRVYRNFESVLDYSERDTLTGLLNRKTFDESFYKSTTSLPQTEGEADGPAAVRRRESARARLPYLAVIDIDHFKSVNDTWGHLIGDEVLLLMSRIMRANFRFHDLLYRFGGEEFVVILRCAGEEDAMRAFERMRAAVQGYAFPQVGQITVSVGFTEVRAADTPNAAFERADQAVYWAKTHGRNRVCGHADLVHQGELNDESKAGDVELF
jgi:diguanylate cyclase (GGDEF)-like protein